VSVTLLAVVVGDGVLVLVAALFTTAIGNDYLPEAPGLDPALLCSFRASLIVRAISRVFRFCGKAESPSKRPLVREPSATTIQSEGSPDLPAGAVPYAAVTGSDHDAAFAGPESAVKVLLTRIMVCLASVYGGCGLECPFSPADVVEALQTQRR
jgi:hypothetical protein